jgi:hypothetical protein
MSLFRKLFPLYESEKTPPLYHILNQFYPVHVFRLWYCNMSSYCPSIYIQSYSHFLAIIIYEYLISPHVL